jgi:Protein of unknown function (DUF664)
MPGLVPPEKDECDALIGYLGQQRYGLVLAAHGLSDSQASETHAPSTLCIAGLVKHLSAVERFWMQIAIDKLEQPDSEEAGAEDYQSSFGLDPGETLKSVLESYAEVAADTDRIIRSVPDLSDTVPVPPGVPWFRQDVEGWSVRWIVLHLIEETARHAGHADLVREAIDGATAFPLMAAVEGWPETPWMKPWKAPA